jgi:hypothetical protein
MKLRYTPQERNYLLLAFVVLIAGTFIAYKTRHPEWMPGIGALVVIVGVVFATRNIEELLASKLAKVSQLAIEFSVADRINDAEENPHLELSQTEKDKIRQQAALTQGRRHSERMSATKRRLQFVEAHIVVIGTAVNGWGQPFMEQWLK